MTVSTDAGSLAVWRGSAFADIDDYDTWETQVNERLHDAMRSGELVPFGIQGDGAFGVRVAVAPDAVSEREARYVFLTSQPYLFVADGGPVFVSGIEHVGLAGSSAVSLVLPAGPHAVRVSMLDWDAEPGSRAPDGRPAPDALADFVVSIAPSDGSETFRVDEATFDPPG